MSEVRPPGLLCRETPISRIQLAPELSQVRGVWQDPQPGHPCRGGCHTGEILQFVDLHIAAPRGSLLSHPLLRRALWSQAVWPRLHYGESPQLRAEGEQLRERRKSPKNQGRGL